MKPHIYMSDGCWHVKPESERLTKRDKVALYWAYLANRKLWSAKEYDGTLNKHFSGGNP